MVMSVVPAARPFTVIVPELLLPMFTEELP